MSCAHDTSSVTRQHGRNHNWANAHLHEQLNSVTIVTLNRRLRSALSDWCAALAAVPRRRRRRCRHRCAAPGASHNPSTRAPVPTRPPATWMRCKRDARFGCGGASDGCGACSHCVPLGGRVGRWEALGAAHRWPPTSWPHTLVPAPYPASGAALPCSSPVSLCCSPQKKPSRAACCR